MTKNFIIFAFIIFSTPINSQEKLIDLLKDGNKLIFIRHAYAPGTGDPTNFKLNDCSTQRNLNDKGRKQAKKISDFFQENQIPIDLVISSEWCRCKETALLSFKSFKTKNFLNSFYSAKFAKNKNKQMSDLKKYVKEWKGSKNLVLVTHYVVIYETLDYSSSSGEIIISDSNKLKNILYDPQTNGPLLFSINKKDQIEFEKKFQLKLGFSPILIGKFKKSGSKLINVID